MDKDKSASYIQHSGFLGTAQGLVSIQLYSGCWWESANARCLGAAENKKLLSVLLLRRNYSTAHTRGSKRFRAPKKKKPQIPLVRNLCTQVEKTHLQKRFESPEYLQLD